MFILGIDPGTTAIGYALVARDTKPRLLGAGMVTITSHDTPGRLHDLYRELSAIIQQWKPDTLSVEKLFFAKNTKTAMDVSQSRGVVLLTAALAGLTVYEYTPLEIKKIVTGDGGADKTQIKKMVHLIFPDHKNLSGRDDMFDAIAAALACCFASPPDGAIHLRA